MIRTLITLLLASLFAAHPIHVAADDGLAGEQEVQPPTEEDLARLALKQSVARAYGEHRRAGGTIESFEPIATDLERRLNGGEPIGDTVTTAPVETRAGTMSQYETMIWRPSYETQVNGWFCGPASAWILLNFKSYGSSYNGQSLTQANLGSSEWLNTTYPSGTGLGSNWTWTLNGWDDGTPAGFYLIDWSPSAQDITDQLVYDVEHEWALVYDIHMNNTKGWLPGYAGRGYTNVWHYIAGAGYQAYGANTSYTDPWSAVSPGHHDDYPVTYLVPMMSDHGMVW